MTESPYITNHKGKWIVVWAESHDAPYTRDLGTGKYETTDGARRACIDAYGLEPEHYGIGF